MTRERFAIQVVSPPAVEPVSLAEAKLHLRVDGGDEDSYIAGLVTAAREACEARSGRALVSTTFRLALDRFPPFQEAMYQPLVSGPAPAVLNTWPLDPSLTAVLVPRSPLQQVTAIAYVDPSGNAQTLSSSGYLVDADSEPARITPAVGSSWPSTQYRPRAATVNFIAGYATPFTANAGSDLLTVAGGRTFANGEVLRLTNVGGALPAGLAAATDYYVVQTAPPSFKLSATLAGSAIDITDAGTGQHFIGQVPEVAKVAIKLLVGHFYENREHVSAGMMKELPFSVDALLGTIAVPNVW